eukprot:4582231-Heterocapsa_arctica.AAC.1
MKGEDISLTCTEKAENQNYIDGSATTIGASAYAGSDRAEVRALLAALEKPIGKLEVITDNQYVRDTAKYLLSGGSPQRKAQ